MIGVRADRVNVKMGRREEPVRMKRMKKEMKFMTQEELIEYFVVLKSDMDFNFECSYIQRYVDIKEKLDVLKTLIDDKEKLFDAVKLSLENRHASKRPVTQSEEPEENN